MPRPRGSITSILQGIILVALLVLGVGLYVQRQAIQDWIRLRDYKPPAAVVKVAHDITLTDRARHVLYVNRPLITGRASFSASCPDNGGEQTIVLGCYHSNQNGIFVFAVTDARLNGVEQVTTAHELLHAAYDRLDAKERAHIDALLESFYNTRLHDERIKNVIAVYKRTEPHDVVNEMHSIFPTEVAQLTPELEAYYKRYFKDRSRVVAMAQSYQREFTDRREAVDRYDAQLKRLKQQIESTKASLDTQSAVLTRDRAALDALAAGGDIAAFNTGVAAYNTKVAKYNADLETLKESIARYNQVVEVRNTVALEQQQLSQAINSNLTPKTQE